MPSIKSEIFTALTEDSVLMAFFGDDNTKVTDEFPSKDLFGDAAADNFPRLTYSMADRKPVFFTDNAPQKDEVIMVFSVWLLPSSLMTVTLAQVASELTRILKTIDYTKTGSDEQFNVDQKVFYTSLTYFKNVDSNL